MNKTSNPRFAFTPLRFIAALIILFLLFVAYQLWGSQSPFPMMGTSGVSYGVAEEESDAYFARDMAPSAPLVEKYGQSNSIAPVPPIYGGDAPAGESKIIRNGNLAMIVENIDVAVAGIHQVRTRLQGQPGNENFSEYGKGVRAGTLTIWVPSDKFDEAVAATKKLALQVTSEQVSVSDVSAQYVDLEARLKNLRATEVQYMEIMKRSGTIEEIVSVTRELSGVRSQIEQIQGGLNYLSRQVALSSITVSLTEESHPTAVKDEWRPFAVLKAAVSDTLSDFTQFIDMLLVFLVKFPLFLLQLAFWVLVLWVLYRIGRFAFEKAGIKFPGR